MSTTLNVLHVLMGGHGRDVNLGEREIILGHDGDPQAALDPALADFWSSFPCPPPWNHGLLFRVNWTACVGQAVGERLKWFMADRCNIRFDGSQLLPDDASEGGGQQEEEELEPPEACSLPCIIMIALASLVFVLLVAGVVFCLCRTRPKHSSPTHQSALNAHPDHAKYYTSCHYASAPVMTRPLETTLRGDRPETRLLTSACSHPPPYHEQCLHVQRHAHPGGGRSSHEALISLMTGGGLSEPQLPNAGPVRQGELPIPPSRSVLSYRRLDGDYVSSSASQTNSDRSHIYESIGDGVESPRSAAYGGTEGSSGTYVHHHDLSLLAGQGDCSRCVPPAAVVADFCECDCGGLAQGHHTGLYDFNMLPEQLDGYYSDRSTQTLPIRPLRHARDQESPVGGQLGFDLDDPSRSQSRLSNRSRRRTSSGSHHSDRSAGCRESGQRRNIPALHPNYFDPPEPPEPDFSTSS